MYCPIKAEIRAVDHADNQSDLIMLVIVMITVLLLLENTLYKTALKPSL